jgi:hypothetical protein
MLEIITSKINWKAALSKVESYDFYHTYDYHQIAKNKEDKVVLIKYIEEDKIICLPIIIRKIKGTDFNDATSVYGYSGPLQKNVDKSFDNSNFVEELSVFFKEQKIISVFSRLNPFIKNQETILNALGEVSKIGNLVNIDITKNLDRQRTLFSKITKRHINKANKFLEIKICKEKNDLKVFKNLYYENMDRVNAKDEYYFSEEYFHELVNSTDFKTDVIFAIDKQSGEIISAAIMIKTNKIIQYHLSGTKTAYLKLSPLRLLIDKMRINGTNEKFKYFNLGGGLGNREDDLFRFKSSFSKDFKSFEVWRYIVNKEVYNNLVQENGVNINLDFFPLYRYNEELFNVVKNK